MKFLSFILIVLLSSVALAVPTQTNNNNAIFNGTVTFNAAATFTIAPTMSGANITNLNASSLATGTAPTARLGSGAASSSTYLRGDQTWATLAATAPGGSNTQVQFNDSSAFGGDAGLTYNKTTDTLTAGTFTGSGSGLTALNAGSLSSGSVTLARGGTQADLSATGGTNRVLIQNSSGAAVTVAQLASGSLSDASNVAMLNTSAAFSGAVSGTNGTFSGQVTAATFSGNGSAVSALNASSLASGTVPIARLPVALNRVTSDVTTTDGTNGIAVTGGSFSIGASEIWTGEFNGRQGVGTDTGGIQYAIDVPSGATVMAMIVGQNASLTSFKSETISTGGTWTSNFHTFGTPGGSARITITVVNSTNAGTVSLKARPGTNGQTVTVFANSYLVARKMQ